MRLLRRLRARHCVGRYSADVLPTAVPRLKKTRRSIASLVPGLGALLDHRIAIQADLDMLLSERAMLIARSEPRAYIATKFLHGHGIEIGALHRPLLLPEGATVQYVDRMSTDDLHEEYPEWEKKDLVIPTLIDDGETLESVPENSVDFIVANHFLEHCEDPIGTIVTHLARLRNGGHLFYAIPDKRQTFDKPRQTTTLAHVIADHQDGGTSSRAEHFLEYSTIVLKSQDPQFHAQDLADSDYSIHFHVWTSTEIA
jgi:predicted SAM-dependent methyltransferase